MYSGKIRLILKSYTYWDQYSSKFDCILLTVVVLTDFIDLHGHWKLLVLHCQNSYCTECN